MINAVLLGGELMQSLPRGKARQLRYVLFSKRTRGFNLVEFGVPDLSKAVRRRVVTQRFSLSVTISARVSPF